MTTLCQPCEPLSKDLVRKWSRLVHGFYIKSGIWYCPCKNRVNYCSSVECKNLSERVDLKIGGSMCEHNRRRSTCKRCGGSQICEHNRQRFQCKECEGGNICEHNKRRSICKECKGGSMCEHNRRRSSCKECGGSQICEHRRIRNQCKECGGSEICEHNRRRSSCKECGGSQICEHNRERSRCKECVGSQICEHSRLRSTCKICYPPGYIANHRRTRRNKVLQTKNPTHTLDDLGMTSKEWLVYLNKIFEDTYGRSRTDDDEVHIDEIIPCSAWNIPEDNKYCWHYLNSQWLLAVDNLSKGSSYTQTDKDEMIKRIDVALSQLKE